MHATRNIGVAVLLSCAVVEGQDEARVVVTHQGESPLYCESVDRVWLRAVGGVVDGWVGEENIRYELLCRLGFYREPVPFTGGLCIGTTQGLLPEEEFDLFARYLDKMVEGPILPLRKPGVGLFRLALFSEEVYSPWRSGTAELTIPVGVCSAWCVDEPTGVLWADTVRPYAPGVVSDAYVVCTGSQMMMITGVCKRYKEGGQWRNTTRIPPGAVAILASTSVRGGFDAAAVLHWGDVIRGESWLARWGAAVEKKLGADGLKSSAAELVAGWAGFARFVPIRDGRLVLRDGTVVDAMGLKIEKAGKSVAIVDGMYCFRRQDLSSSSPSAGSLVVISVPGRVVVIDMEGDWTYSLTSGVRK